MALRVVVFVSSLYVQRVAEGVFQVLSVYIREIGLKFRVFRFC